MTSLPVAAGSGNFLVQPGIGLMIWTLLTFGVAMYILSKAVFPRIQNALDKRQKAIEETLDASERARREADELLAEYRERLRAARSQSEEIIARANRAAENHEAKTIAEARRRREELMEQARRDIEQETRRAIQEIRQEGGGLTVMATEKVTRKTLTEDDQKRLVEEALEELDFAALAGGEREEGRPVEEIGGVYARALFEAASEQDKLDEIREQLGQFVDALEESRDLSLFFFSPYFSADEKQEGLEKAVDGADEALMNFLELLLANHRMPAIYRIRQEYERLWAEENKILPVEVTSAIELDEKTIKSIGD